jgi:hypothetical protein
MDTVLGLLLLAAFIPCVIAVAASVTWAVVRLFPGESKTASGAAAPDTPA